MKNRLLTMALGVLICIGASSCSKDDENQSEPLTTPEPSAKTQMITSKNWKLVEYKVDGVDLLNGPGPFPTCTIDDTYLFQSDSTIVRNDAGQKCSSTTKGKWFFINNENMISIVIPNNNLYFLNGDFEIELISNSKLNLIRKRNNTVSLAKYIAQ